MFDFDSSQLQAVPYRYQSSKHMNWISFDHWTLRLGNIDLPVWILWFWAMLGVMLLTGKTITGRGQVYSRVGQPIRYWLCSLMWGFITGWVTFIWNVAFKGLHR